MVAYTEEEQVERLRGWWEKNGTQVVAAIVIALLAIFGVRYWQGSQEARATAASVVYQELVDSQEAAVAAPSEEATVRVQELAEILINEHDKTAYADFARLHLARLAVDAEAYQQAAEYLDAVASKGRTDALRWAARLRLARLQVFTNDQQAAAKTLNASWPNAYKAQALELKGDLALLQGDGATARSHYQASLEAESVLQERVEYVQMKLDDLAI